MQLYIYTRYSLSDPKCSLLRNKTKFAADIFMWNFIEMDAAMILLSAVVTIRSTWR